MAFVFVTLNGYMQVRGIQLLGKYGDSWFWDPRFVVGTLLFFMGMAINIHSDHILRNLRKPGDVGYKIPRGSYNYITGYYFELLGVPKMYTSMSHYRERASASGFKDAATPRFGHSDVIVDLFIKTDFV